MRAFLCDAAVKRSSLYTEHLLFNIIFNMYVNSHTCYTFKECDCASAVRKDLGNFSLTRNFREYHVSTQYC